MLAALDFSQRSGQQGTISMSSHQGSTPENVKELFNLKHTSLRVTIERAFAALKKKLRSLIRSHSAPSPPKLSLFLHIVFCTTGSYGGVWMSSSQRRILARLVSVPPITSLGGTRGRSGQMICGLTKSTP
jgi:hypothetical protein